MRCLIRAYIFAFAALLSWSVSAQDSLYQIVSEGKEDTTTVRAYIKLSAATSKKDYDSAVYYATKGRNLAKKIDDGKGYTACLMRMGNAYMFKGVYDSAHNVYTEALTYYQETKNYIGVGKVYNNLGLMNRYKADYVQSAEFFLKSLEVKKEHGSDVDVGVGYQNLGIVFAIQGDFETAEKYLLDALDRFKISGDSTKYYSVLLDVSSMYREQGKMDASLSALQQCYDYNKREGNNTVMGICIYNMAFTSQLKDDLEQAIVYYNEAKALFVELGNKVRVSGCNIRLAICYKENEQLALAKAVALEGLEMFKELSSPVQEYKTLKILAEIEAQQGQHKKAYAYRLEYEALKDSVTLEENNVKIAELKAKHEGEIDKRKIAELTAENKQSELRSRKRQIQSYFLYGAVLLILLIAIMFYSRGRNKKKMNDVLREKNSVIKHSLDEKEVLLREIYHRVQNNLQFVSSLLNLQSRRVEDQGTKNVLKECKLRIQSMALIHQRLYQEDSLKGISFSSYLKNLIKSLQQSYQIEEGRIATILDIEDVLIDIDTAISLGLILNELITNAYKYAFPNDSKGELRISLKQQNQGIKLTVADNGIGIQNDFDISTSDSFGLKLVRSLAKKLSAELDFTYEDGTQIVININEFKQVE
ncbi:MAG: tetratricopeptide repeat protein [Bacteroidia bacterium]